MFNIKSIPWKRRITQLAFLGVLGEFSFYGIFRCPFAVPYVSCGSCPVVQCPGRKLWLFFWVGLGLSALLFGRAFCSWACPAGLITELFGKYSFFRGKAKASANVLISAGKYLVLAAGTVVFLFFHNPRWAIPIRTGEFWNSVKLTFEHADTLWLVRTFFVMAGIFLAFLFPQFWCRYLCPTGGILEALKRFSVFRYFMKDNCNDCDRCRDVCTMKTRPEENNCTGCGDCQDACHAGAIAFSRKNKILKNIQAKGGR